MKILTEEQAFAEAGESPLTVDERHEVAAAVARQCSGVVTRALCLGNFSDLRKVFSTYQQEARQRKALNSWVSKTGAIYDSRRRSWVIVGVEDRENTEEQVSFLPEG